MCVQRLRLPTAATTLMYETRRSRRSTLSFREPKLIGLEMESGWCSLEHVREKRAMHVNDANIRREGDDDHRHRHDLVHCVEPVCGNFFILDTTLPPRRSCHFEHCDFAFCFVSICLPHMIAT